jgi:hypothetical protein
MMEGPMASLYGLEHADGTPTDPPTLKTAVPTRRPGDTIPLRSGRTLRVLDVKGRS